MKHKAVTLRRQRAPNPVSDDGERVERAARGHTHDQAAQNERLRQGGEALGQLRPQKIRALLLRAEGYTYAELPGPHLHPGCLTFLGSQANNVRKLGWMRSWRGSPRATTSATSPTGPTRKVNRCLTEGRHALAITLAGIEGGIECARLAPRLAALAGREAAPRDGAVAPAMKSCLSCRARLKRYGRPKATGRKRSLRPPDDRLANPSPRAGRRRRASVFPGVQGDLDHDAAGDDLRAAGDGAAIAARLTDHGGRLARYGRLVH